jgi:predicted RND superfamily exporter protein
MRTRAQWLATLVCLVCGLAVVAGVDLTPRLGGEFFFASDDPELQQSAEIERRFGSADQIFIAAASADLDSPAYVRRIRGLTDALVRTRGVAAVRSIARTGTSDDPGRAPAEVLKAVRESPLWSRLLLAPDRSATFILVRLADAADEAAAVQAIDRIVDRHDAPGFRLSVAGVPYVAEHLRQELNRELRFFSLAAFAAFAVLITLIFRSVAILVGTLLAALTACFATFLLRALLGMPTDVLTPNLWTIAFVLTLSHVVYLAAEWRAEARTSGAAQAVRRSVRLVGPASAWSLVANLLGFGSLLFAAARPLREFGQSGAIAAVVAMACAFAIFPPFLRSADPGREDPSRGERRLARFFRARHPLVAIAILLVALLLAPFAWRVNTDPALPSYFPEAGRVGQGLRAFDRAGGSSPLDLVVSDARGARLDSGDAFDRLRALQRDLERHEDVGSVVSIALLMAEADRPWYSFLFSWTRKVNALDSPGHGRVGRTFISANRKEGRFILRMHELERERPREAVVRDVEALARRHGFQARIVAGLYPLQGALSELVEGSVRQGLAGLFGLVAVIALIVTRSIRIAIAMAVSVAIPPLALFGLVGLSAMPVDIVSAPAANVALPLGVDEMIHLGYAVRRARRREGGAGDGWQPALARLWRPILASMLIVVAGFLLFVLSPFPPTRRLGALVCIGAALTDLAVLVVLPALATLSVRRSGRRS